MLDCRAAMFPLCSVCCDREELGSGCKLMCAVGGWTPSPSAASQDTADFYTFLASYLSFQDEN